MANLLDVVREEFFSRLQSQTNWGKNQIQALYNEVQRDVLSATIENDDITNNTLTMKAQENLKKTMSSEERENIMFNKKPFKDKGFYNPRGTSAYDSMETPIPNDDNPFFADEDINKDSR